MRVFRSPVSVGGSIPSLGTKIPKPLIPKGLRGFFVYGPRHPSKYKSYRRFSGKHRRRIDRCFAFNGITADTAGTPLSAALFPGPFLLRFARARSVLECSWQSER